MRQDVITKGLVYAISTVSACCLTLNAAIDLCSCLMFCLTAGQLDNQEIQYEQSGCDAGMLRTNTT